MRGEGLRRKVGGNHRDESDHHVAADQPGGGGARGHRTENTRI